MYIYSEFFVTNPESPTIYAFLYEFLFIFQFQNKNTSLFITLIQVDKKEVFFTLFQK